MPYALSIKGSSYTKDVTQDFRDDTVLRLHALNPGDLGFIPGQVSKSYVFKLSSHAAVKRTCMPHLRANTAKQINVKKVKILLKIYQIFLVNHNNICLLKYSIQCFKYLKTMTDSFVKKKKVISNSTRNRTGQRNKIYWCL